MKTEDILELGLIALIVGGVAYILYEAFGFFNQSGATGAVSAALAPVTKASDTLFGKGAGTPGTDSNLFYSGVENFFTSGSVYGDQGSN